MSKQPISKFELAHLFRTKMDEHLECPRDIQVEIRDVKTSSGPGWSAVTNEADSLAHVGCARIVGALTLELRPLYEVID